MRDSSLILLCKGLKAKASIPTIDLIPLVRRYRNNHSLAIQVPIANTDIYKCNFFLQTIRHWNIKSEMRSFKSNENIHKKEGGSYYVVSANKASPVTL